MEAIYDHHVYDPVALERSYPRLSDVRIEVPVGSACTIVGDMVRPTQFLREQPQLVDPAIQRLLASAILIDTNNFDLALYGPRWVDKDRTVYEGLAGDRFPGLYGQLSSMKFDVGSNVAMGMRNALRKDCKETMDGGVTVIYSTVYMPLEKLYLMQWDELVATT